MSSQLSSLKRQLFQINIPVEQSKKARIVDLISSSAKYHLTDFDSPLNTIQLSEVFQSVNRHLVERNVHKDGPTYPFGVKEIDCDQLRTENQDSCLQYTLGRVKESNDRHTQLQSLLISGDLAYSIMKAAIMAGSDRYLHTRIYHVHKLGQVAALTDRKSEVMVVFMYVCFAKKSELTDTGLTGKLQKKVDALLTHAPVLVFNSSYYAFVQRGKAFKRHDLDGQLFARCGRVLKECHAIPTPWFIVDDLDDLPKGKRLVLSNIN